MVTMGVRQYVGARYVPKFADPVAWQSGTSYEALTIVTYNNASYTSKIPVPATVGNPADNDSYWALTGNYNAQVEDYRQTTLQVQENLKDEITNCEEAVTAEATARENADTAIGDRITSEVETINNTINKYYPKSILCIGDSYTQGAGGSGVSDGWPAKLGSRHNYTIYNYGEGFGLFTSNTHGWPTYLSMLQKASAAGVKPDIIIIAGGANDFKSDPVFSQSEAEETLSYAKNTFNVPVYFILIGLMYDATIDHKMEIANTIKFACYNTDTYYADFRPWIRAQRNTKSDDLYHLTAIGYSFVSDLMDSYIRTGLLPNLFWRDTSATYFRVDISDKTVNFVNNGNVNITFTPKSTNLGGSSLNYTADFILTSYTNLLYNTGNIVHINATGYVQGTDSEWHDASFSISLTNNQMNIYIHCHGVSLPTENAQIVINASTTTYDINFFI